MRKLFALACAALGRRRRARAALEFDGEQLPLTGAPQSLDLENDDLVKLNE
jgi:hypothetical protein